MQMPLPTEQNQGQDPAQSPAIDPKALIATAGQPEGTPPAGDPGQATSAPGGDESEIGRHFLSLMQSDPNKAEQILKILEGGEAMDNNNQQLPGMPGQPPQALPGQSPAAMPGMPGMPGAQPPTAAPGMPPQAGMMPQQGADPAMLAQVMQELQAIKQILPGMQNTMGEYHLDKNLGDMKNIHGQLRGHFGDALPEDFKTMETPAMQLYSDLMQGKVPLHEAAIKMVALQKALEGDAPLKDRMVAMAAQGAQPPMTPEGRGGGVPAPGDGGQKPLSTTADRMNAIRQKLQAMQGMAGV